MDEGVRQQVAAERKKIVVEARKEVEQDFAIELKDRSEQLKESQEKLRQAQERELGWRNRKRGSLNCRIHTHRFNEFEQFSAGFCVAKPWDLPLWATGICPV